MTALDQTHRYAAESYQQIARRAARIGNFLAARVAYHQSLQEWTKATSAYPSLQPYQLAARKEFLSFVRRDAVYPLILSQIVHHLSQRPGISRSWLMIELNSIHRRDLEIALDLAIASGVVRSESNAGVARLFLSAPPQPPPSLLERILMRVRSVNRLV